jgi:ubiquinone/menaquinone biosynthesis C-methylase UbiE
MVRRLTAGLSGDAIDYGAGWGDIAYQLAGQFTSMRGFDVSPARVAFARTQFAPIPFDQCDPDGLPQAADASADVVLSIVVLPFVPDVAGYLAECARVLRPGGTLVVAIPNPHSNKQLLYGWFGKVYREDRRIGSEADFMARLAGHGFVVDRRDGFYDPPFDRLRNLGDVALALLNVVGHLLGRSGRVSYVGYRGHRTATP